MKWNSRLMGSWRVGELGERHGDQGAAQLLRRRRRGCAMSWRASAYIKALIVCPNGERISRTEKLVALVLADSHQDKANAFTFPAVKMIAEDSLMDPRVCRRILSGLERKGVIERERSENQGRGQITFYRFPELDGKQPKGGHGVPLSKPEKEDNMSPLFFGKRRTEGGRK